MKFEKIRINNFRNIKTASIDINSKDVVLVGTNGQGKTNFLESIYILCYGSSFRTDSLKNCIKNGESDFSIIREYVDDNLEGEIKIVFKEGKRKIYLDNREIRDRKELIYQFPCIVFCHQDISFITGEPENRRKFFNQMMSLYSPTFFDNLRMYNLLLSQRNSSIKKGDSIYSLYDERLAYYGLEIIKERTLGVYEFNKIFPKMFSEISNTDYKLEIVYQPSWNNLGSVNEIVEYLESNIERDFIMNTTTSGIHRDKFIIMSQYGNFASLGSTGQIRLCSILFRISEALYFSKMTGRKPILLIDDVLLELDPDKRGNLIKKLSNYSQSYFTFLPSEKYFNEDRNELIFYVKDGQFIND